MKRDQSFSIVLSKEEKTLLQQLAKIERISAAAVVRRLIWREAEHYDLPPPTRQQAASTPAGAQAET